MSEELTPPRYFCAVCKFWDDKPGKDIYHCPHCGICRIGTSPASTSHSHKHRTLCLLLPAGKGLEIDFFHCFTCGACMSVTMRDHKCIENNLKSNWCVAAIP